MNVDLFSPEGINRAASMGLVPSRVSDMTYTPLLVQSSDLFQPESGATHPTVWGRLFVFVRDPIKRALNCYEQIQIESGNSAMTLTEFANNPFYAENNPLVRALIGIGPTDTLNDAHLAIAKAVLDNQVLIGLFDDADPTKFDESVFRIERFLEWFAEPSTDMAACHQQISSAYALGYAVSQEYQTIDARGYNLIVAAHRLDIQLYTYALTVFHAQSSLFGSTSG